MKSTPKININFRSNFYSISYSSEVSENDFVMPNNKAKNLPQDDTVCMLDSSFESFEPCYFHKQLSVCSPYEFA